MTGPFELFSRSDARIASRVIAVLVLLLAGIVLLGWSLDVDFIKRIYTGYASMKVNMALGLASAAAALYAMTLDKSWRPPTLLFAAIAITIGGLTVIEYALGANIGIDELFVANPEAPMYPGRPSLVTAICLLLLGVSAAASWTKSNLLFLAPIVGVMFFSIASLLGYSYDVKSLYTAIGFDTVALHTAAALLFLSIGYIFARSESVVMKILADKHVGGTVARMTMAGAIAAIITINILTALGRLAGLYDVSFQIVATSALSIMALVGLAIAYGYGINRFDTTINKLKRANRELLEAQAHNDAMMTSIANALVVTDADGRVLMTNQNYDMLLGEEKNSEVGKRITNVLPFYSIETGERRSDENHPVTICLDTKKPTTLTTHDQWAIKNTSGRLIPVTGTVSPVMAGGEAIGAVGIYRDMVQEYEINKAKTEFVSFASHELRTPVSIVGLYTQMLLEGRSGDINKEQRQTLDRILDANRNMNGLIDSMLAVSRLDMGALQLDMRQTDVGELFRDVLDELEPKIKKKKHHIKINFSNKPLIINCDNDIVTRVLHNYMTNAIKYTPEKGSITVDIQTLHKGSSIGGKVMKQKELIFSVQDTGIGIPLNQQHKVFEKLTRADNARNDYEGTGLGLYIVRASLESCGGNAWMESEEGKGSTFYASLPCRVSEAV